MQVEPGAIIENRFRIERLVAAHNGVTVWNATDLLHACTVELVISRGGTMVDVARIAPRAARPVLELVEITDEDAFFEEPPPPELFYAPPRSKALWLVGIAAVACAAIGAGALYTKHSSARAIAANDEEVTITRAELPIPTAAPPPPAVMTVDETPPPAPTPPKAVVAPKRLPRPHHRAAPPPLPLPAHDDPLTL